MSQVLVRDVSPRTVEKLKKRAREHGRSLQNELKEILEHAARMSPSEIRSAAERIRKSLIGRRHTDSVVLLRQDRGR